MKNYFVGKGLKTVRIPVTMDMKTIKPVLSRKNTKRLFLYAGSPGGKDPLNTMIDGFRLLPEADKSRVEFWILGVDWLWLKKKYGYSNSECKEMTYYIKPFGCVSRDEVIDRLCTVDFTILIRPEELRYTKAGFPTKVTESLAYGTPVITNLTSDLGKYIKDGINGFVVKEGTGKELKLIIERVINAERSIKINKDARRLAEEELDYRKYVDKIQEL